MAVLCQRCRGLGAPVPLTSSLRPSRHGRPQACSALGLLQGTLLTWLPAHLGTTTELTLMKMFPTPERRLAGSRWDHIRRIGLPFSGA